jgi:subtilisin family serine protease
LRHTYFKKFLFFFMAVCLTVTVAFADSWIINSKSNGLPKDLEKMVQKAGGKLVKLLPQVGMAIAEFDNESQARGFETNNLEIVPDVVLNWLPPNEKIQASNIGEDETYYPYQWHLPVIGADKAWDAGVTGAGVRVAVLDTGIWYYHPDLIPNMDHASSISFVPYEPDYLDGDGHGTHVAGIIAAVDNDWGSIGVAPDATIFAVKVLDNTGSGAYSWIAAGVVHAVLEQADIINMSLGGYLLKSGYEPNYTARDAAILKNMMKKVINWASSEGTLVVVSAGNEAVDLNKIGNIIAIPAETGDCLTISATGPIGLQNFDRMAHYTNYGNGAIDLAAPGGDWMLNPNGYWYLDMVFSTTVGGWMWAAGTSMSAPNVSGVAALVISRYGRMPVGNLKNHLGQTADDLGKPGNDEFYGKGRINAYKAVTQK